MKFTKFFNQDQRLLFLQRGIAALLTVIPTNQDRLIKFLLRRTQLLAEARRDLRNLNQTERFNEPNLRRISQNRPVLTKPILRIKKKVV